MTKEFLKRSKDILQEAFEHGPMGRFSPFYFEDGLESVEKMLKETKTNEVQVNQMEVEVEEILNTKEKEQIFKTHQLEMFLE